ncbi:hypothetical protein CSUI_010093, partial [Cystoisospora suis]
LNSSTSSPNSFSNCLPSFCICSLGSDRSVRSSGCTE